MTGGNPTLGWEDAVAGYVVLRAASDAMPEDAVGEDEAVDRYCVAMDRLIEKVPAPHLAAVAFKIALAEERADPFEGCLFDKHTRGIVRDVKALAGVGSSDPHRGWLNARNALMVEANAPASEGLDALFERMNALEECIMRTPATSLDGMLAKVLLLAQTCLEGFQPDIGWVADTIQESRTLTGMGETSYAVPEGARSTNASATFVTIMDAQDAARDRYNALPSDLEGSDPVAFEREERLLHAALSAADRAVPVNGSQFLRLLTHMAESTAIDDDNAQHLLTQARTLWGPDQAGAVA